MKDKNEKKDKELKNALQSVVAPLLIGLRNDQVAIVDALKSLNEKTASKDSVKLQIINETEGARDVNVKNLPEVLKVEVTNQEKGIEEVSVKNLNEISVEVVKELEVLRQSVDALKADLFAIVESVQSTIKDTQQVEVKNQVKFPDVQKVELKTPIDIPKSTKISNKLASEAIPVKLVTADGRKFYEAIAQLISSGGGVDLYPIKQKLDALITAVEAISISGGSTDMTATNALITLTNGYVDGLETALASANTKLDTLHTDFGTLSAYVDGLEALATTLNGYVDGLEALATSLNGYVDGVETKLDTLNTTAASPSPAASASVVGCLPLYDSSMGATAQEVKASAGSLYGYHLINPNTTIAYVQIFNTASGSVTVGTTTPIMVLAIPPQGTLEMTFTIPISFSTAIVYACTTTVSGNTAMTTPPYGTFFYK